MSMVDGRWSRVRVIGYWNSVVSMVMAVCMLEVRVRAVLVLRPRWQQRRRRGSGKRQHRGHGGGVTLAVCSASAISSPASSPVWRFMASWIAFARL